MKRWRDKNYGSSPKKLEQKTVAIHSMRYEILKNGRRQTQTAADVQPNAAAFSCGFLLSERPVRIKTTIAARIEHDIDHYRLMVFTTPILCP